MAKKPTEAMPIEISFGDSGHEELGLLKCPICAESYTHVKRGFPYIENGEDEYKTRGGVVRGNLSVLRFECEGGHDFEVCFGFHKGLTFVFTRLPVDQERA